MEGFSEKKMWEGATPVSETDDTSVSENRAKLVLEEIPTREKAATEMEMDPLVERFVAEFEDIMEKLQDCHGKVFYGRSQYAEVEKMAERATFLFFEIPYAIRTALWPHLQHVQRFKNPTKFADAASR